MAGLCNMGLFDTAEYENHIIRPRRNQYTMADLGANQFMIYDKLTYRRDFELKNVRGLRLQCSLFQAAYDPKVDTVIVFLHGNGGCRRDALPLLSHAITNSMALFAFDFAGCGHSDGEYITLGYNERDDVDTVMSHIRKATPSLRNIVLWGKSMGAATALLVAERNQKGTGHKIAAVVADSPYSSLEDVVCEVAGKYAFVPGFLVSQGVDYVRGRIQERTGADLLSLCPKKSVRSIRCPVMIGVANGDDLTLPVRVREVFDNVASNNGRNRFVQFSGDHFSLRTAEFIQPAIDFILSVVTRITPKSNLTLDLGQSVARSSTYTAGPPSTTKNQYGLQSPFASVAMPHSINQSVYQSVAEPAGLDKSVAKPGKDKIFQENGSTKSLFSSQISEVSGAAQAKASPTLSESTFSNKYNEVVAAQQPERPIPFQRSPTVPEQVMQMQNVDSPPRKWSDLSISQTAFSMQHSCASTPMEKKTSPFIKAKDGKFKRSIFD